MPKVGVVCVVNTPASETSTPLPPLLKDIIGTAEFPLPKNGSAPGGFGREQVPPPTRHHPTLPAGPSVPDLLFQKGPPYVGLLAGPSVVAADQDCHEPLPLRVSALATTPAVMSKAMLITNED